MPVTDAFLQTCRDDIIDLTELTAFRTAYALYDAASHANKGLYWALCFSDSQTGLSPAYRLKKGVRDTVLSLATASISPTERESAYRTLSAEYVPSVDPPPQAVEESAELQTLLVQELLS